MLFGEAMYNREVQLEQSLHTACSGSSSDKLYQHTHCNAIDVHKSAAMFTINVCVFDAQMMGLPMVWENWLAC